MEIRHPYSPEIPWRLAVSRRFTSPRVDKIFKEIISPVLRLEGMVLECFFAKDLPEHEDFWVNRMNLILDLTDVHIMIDIDTTPATNYELNKSLRIRRTRVRHSLTENFGENIGLYHKLLGAPRIIVIKEGDQRNFSNTRFKTFVCFSETGNVEQFARTLQNQVVKAKQQAIKDIIRREKWVRRLTPTILTIFGNEVPLAPPEQRKDWLIVYQNIAQLLFDGYWISDIQKILKGTRNTNPGTIADVLARRDTVIVRAVRVSERAPVKELVIRIREDAIGRKRDSIPQTVTDSLGSMIRYVKNEEIAFVLKIKQRHRKSFMSFKRILMSFLRYYRIFLRTIRSEFLGTTAENPTWLSLIVFCWSLYRMIQVKLLIYRLKKG
jgi:hypothetical protein